MKKDLLTGHLLSEWATKRSRCAEYTCGEQWVDLGPVNIIIVRTEAKKQDFTASHRDRLGLPAKWFREIKNWHHGVKCLLVLATFIWPGNLYYLACKVSRAPHNVPRFHPTWFLPTVTHWMLTSICLLHTLCPTLQSSATQNMFHICTIY